MKKTYLIPEYGIKRTTENTYTHAVVFNNLSWSGAGTGIGASFHKSLKLAEKEANRKQKYSWLEVIKIVELENN